MERLRDALVHMAVVRLVREGGWRSWSQGQVAHATGLPLEAVARAWQPLTDAGRLHDTHGVRYGELKVQSVDGEWERKVWEFVTGCEVA
jgi:hypothetical protein